MLEVGKCYYCRINKGTGLRARVRKILRIENKLVHYEVLHGPAPNGRYGVCALRRFANWKEVAEDFDFNALDGAIWRPTCMVLNVKGEPILRCGNKRKNFYLRKGYATEVSPGVLQFTNDSVEKRLEALYGPNLHDFFMEVKNDHCVVCGAAYPLTRHHVVPRRHKSILSLKYRACLSNILFVCIDCHKRYEDCSEPQISFDPNESEASFRKFCDIWRDHFFELMEPKHVPNGWTLITVKNFDAVDLVVEKKT